MQASIRSVLLIAPRKANRHICLISCINEAKVVTNQSMTFFQSLPKLQKVEASSFYEYRTGPGHWLTEKIQSSIQRQFESPDPRRPGGWMGRSMYCSLPSKLCSHFSSLSTMASIILASSSLGAQVPALVYAPLACSKPSVLGSIFCKLCCLQVLAILAVRCCQSLA